MCVQVLVKFPLTKDEEQTRKSLMATSVLHMTSIITFYMLYMWLLHDIVSKEYFEHSSLFHTEHTIVHTVLVCWYHVTHVTDSVCCLPGQWRCGHFWKKVRIVMTSSCDIM